MAKRKFHAPVKSRVLAAHSATSSSSNSSTNRSSSNSNDVILSDVSVCEYKEGWEEARDEWGEIECNCPVFRPKKSIQNFRYVGDWQTNYLPLR